VGADGRLRYFETTYDAAALQAAIRAELD
jgi:hypothetical protein